MTDRSGSQSGSARRQDPVAERAAVVDGASNGSLEPEEAASDGSDQAEELDLADDELWCGTCESSVGEEELTEEGACPECGSQLVEAERRTVPWKFKFMIAATVVYLGYRLYQGIGWIVHHA